jgi:FecR protein.
MKRSSRSSSSWEVPVFVLLSLQLCGAGFLLYRDYTSTPERSSSERVIGSIVYRQHQAERKYSGQVLWGSLQQNSPVYNLDTLRTASDSSATVYLEDKTQIELGEDTLLVLDMSGADKKIDLSGGSLNIDRAQSAGSLKVATSSGELDMAKGAASLAVDKKSLSVAVSAGSASFKGAKASKKVELGTQKSVSLASDGSVAAAALDPIAPRKGKQLVALGDDATVDFAWMGPESFAGRLAIASDEKMANESSSLDVSGRSAQAQLPPGSYFWRLTGSDGSTSRVMRFTIIAAEHPRAIRPADGSMVAFTGAKAPLVGFSWTASPLASSYRVEASADSSFSSLAVSLRTERSSIATEKLGTGAWYWRVVALFPGQGLEAASEPASFSIQRIVERRPEWRGGSSALSVSSLSAKQGAVSLSWEPIDGADSYRVLVARDDAFKDIVMDQTVSTNALRVSSELDEGTYYVDVRAIADGKEGPPSIPRSLVVTKPKPIKLVSPAPGASLSPEDKSIAFAWYDPNRGSRFKVELSADPRFATALGSTTAREQKAELALPEGSSGTLYWRVSSLSESGETLLASEAASLVLPLPLPSPVLREPADGEEIDINVRADLAFAWEPAPGATEYRLALYRLTGGGQILVREWSTDKTRLDVKRLDFLSSDSYAWKLTALRPEKDGPGSRSPAATGYFKLFQSAPLKAPTLVIPERIFAH